MSTTESLRDLEVQRPGVFFVGENASGKSPEKFVIFLLLIASSILVSAAAGKSKGAGTPTLLWSADVIRAIDVNRPGLSFLDNGQLIVYQVDVDICQFSSRESPTASSPFRLRLSAMDASSGKIALTKEWGTRSSGSSVQMTSDGIVIRTGEVLRFLSKDFAELRQMALPQAAFEDWEIRTSPTRKTVLINHDHINRKENLNFSQLEVLDGGTFKTRLNWTESPGITGKYTITDNLVAMDRREQDRWTVVAKGFGTALWHMLFDVSGSNCSPGRASGMFVTESLLVCADKVFTLSSIKGEVLMTDYFAKGEGAATKISTTPDGAYAAVTLEKYSDVWDRGGHITSLSTVVYDLSGKKRVTTISMSSPPKSYYDLALSPDGSKLAILSDRTVYVYALRNN